VLSSLAKVTGEVEAFIGAQNDDGSSASAAPVLTIAGTDPGDGVVVVDADATMNAVADTFLVGASFGLTVSVAEPRAELSGKTRAYVRDGVSMTAATLQVQAGNRATAVEYNATATTFLLSLGGLASVSVLQANALVDGTVEAYVGAPFNGPVTGGAGITDISGAVTINAWSDMNANAGFGDDGFTGIWGISRDWRGSASSIR
jgi:hypothetical protein